MTTVAGKGYRDAVGVEVAGVDARTVNIGDLFNLNGVEIGRIGKLEGDFVSFTCTATVVPTPLFFALVLEHRSFIEQRVRHLTMEKLPVHDPPVAWEVHDHPLARIGIPCIASTGMSMSGVGVLDSPRYLPAEIPVLDGEPGRRS
jgi:hypothetical protein